MPSILIIGATRGLGASLANLYAEDPSNTVFGTTRSSSAPTSQSSNKNIIWLKDIDVSQASIGTRLVDQLGNVVDGKTKQLDIVVRR
jgi:NAD(P)-dependent dehydrogenase (short-subunit alcohol dehydrogenase family)